MDEPSLRAILGRLGIQAEKRNRRGWLEFKCPLSPWTHDKGFDTRPSAAAKVSETGPSSFVCKACHSHGRISKLVNLLAGYRQDNSIRPLMREADLADTMAHSDARYPDFEETIEIDTIPAPLDIGMYEGVYDRATSSPDAMDYLEGRGVSGATADKLNLHYDDRQRRVLFPVYTRDSSFYGFTGRAIDPGIQPKVKDYFGLPKRFLILGEHLWQNGRPLIIVEGLFAYAHLIELGVNVNVGAILGSAMTREKAARITNLGERTYLLNDNDTGGDIGLFGTPTPEGGREHNGAIDMLTEHVTLYVPEWPNEKSDPDELTLKEVEDILSYTRPWSQFSFDKLWLEWV